MLTYATRCHEAEKTRLELVTCCTYLQRDSECAQLAAVASLTFRFASVSHSSIANRQQIRYTLQSVPLHHVIYQWPTAIDERQTRSTTP